MRSSNLELEFWIKIFIVGVVVLIAAVDLVLLGRYGQTGTISYVLRRLSGTFPIFPYLVAFGMGALLYHMLDR